MLLLKSHELFVHLWLVVLVLLPDLLDPRLHDLHRPLGLDLLDEQGEQDQPDDHCQQDDGQGPGEEAVVAEDVRENSAVEEADGLPHEVVQRIQH